MSPMAHRGRYITRARKAFQSEQHKVQAKTFTKWMNSYLSKRQQPYLVLDLMEDVADGRALLALLEALTGDRLPESKGLVVGRPRHIINISTALEFLKSKGIRLVNINATDIADGKPQIVLGLIWTIILHFHIGGATTADPVSASEAETSPSPEASGSLEPEVSPTLKACEETLSEWTEGVLSEQGVPFEGFGAGWRDGRAFLALIEHVQPGLVDQDKAEALSCRERLEQAFTLAQDSLHVPRLLDPADVDVDAPDGKSVMTYVAHFRNCVEPFRHPGPLHKVAEKEERLVLPEAEEMALEMEKTKQSVTILRHQVFDVQEQALHYVEVQAVEAVQGDLTSVQSDLLQLVRHLHRHLHLRLQHTQGLLDEMARLADSYRGRRDKEGDGQGEQDKAVPASIGHVILLLTQLKGRLDDVISAVDEDLTKATEVGCDKELSWSVTHDALLVLIQSDDSATFVTDTSESGSQCSLLTLFCKINGELSRLDKEEFTADFFEEGEVRKATEEAVMALTKEFALEGDFTVKLAAFVQKRISMLETLLVHHKTLSRQRNLHTFLTERPKEQESLKVSLFNIESELKTEVGQAAWFNMEEARELHTSMEQVVAQQHCVIARLQDLLARVLEMKDPSLQCAESLETKMAQMGTCLRNGEEVFLTLKLRGPCDVIEETNEEGPAHGNTQDGGQWGANLGERRGLLDTWVTEAQLQLHQAEEELDKLKVFHPSIDDEQLRKGLTSVNDKIKLVQRLATSALIKREFGEVEARHQSHLHSLESALAACHKQQSKDELPPLAAQLQQLHQHLPLEKQQPLPHKPEVDETVIYVSTALSEVLTAGERSLATMGDLGRLLKSVSGETTLLARRDAHREKWHGIYNGAVHPAAKEPDDLHTIISQCLFLLLLISFWLGQITP